MSDKKLFTKSAFKEALRCYTGMYYYGSKAYANQNNEDDFLQALAAYTKLQFTKGPMTSALKTAPPPPSLLRTGHLVDGVYLGVFLRHDKIESENKQDNHTHYDYCTIF